MGACFISQPQECMQGLFSGYAYSLLVCRKGSTINARSCIKMCKIRDPHCEGEWTGRWSDCDTQRMWERHPNVKSVLNFRRKDDGTFWISFKDFVSYFDTISLNKRSMTPYLEGCHPDILRGH